MVHEKDLNSRLDCLMKKLLKFTQKKKVGQKQKRTKKEREIQRERERVREIREKTGDVCFTHLLFFVCVFFFEFFKVAFIATTTKKK